MATMTDLTDLAAGDLTALTTMVNLMADHHLALCAVALGLSGATADDVRAQLVALAGRDAAVRADLAKFYHACVATPEPVRRVMSSPPPVRRVDCRASRKLVF